MSDTNDQTSRPLLPLPNRLELSNRDRDAFLALIEDTEAKPNPALAAAAERYKKQMGLERTE